MGLVVVVTVTGPESTGKTTLAERLAGEFGGEWSPESARGYAEARLAAGDARPLLAADVEPIARGQIALEDAAVARAHAGGRRLVVRDTDLVSTVAYARHYYGACPDWVVRAAAERRAHRYLLLVPAGADWAPDPVRDGPAAGEALVGEFRRALAELGCEVVEIGGGWATRAARARAAVASLLAPTPFSSS